MAKSKMTRKVSFENTHRLIEQSVKINDIIRESISNEMYETERKAIHDVNKAVFELAEDRGVSIWDICFHFVPQYDYSGFEIDDSDPQNVKYTSKGCVRLVPVEFELEKGPDYWEGRYRQLKKEIQDVLDDEIGRDRK